jgi:hypothetical protein
MGSFRRMACDVENAEGTREPQKSTRLRDRGTCLAARRTIRPGPGADPARAADAGRKTDRTREPQDSWRVQGKRT